MALVLALVATVAVASAAVVVSAGHAGEQTLAVAMTAQGSQVERRDGYTAARPIVLHVDAPRAQGVTLIGIAPDGGNLRVPLARAADGSFGGEIALAMPGIWSLAIASHTGAAEAASEPFAISVVEGVSQRALTVVLALALLLLAGGLGLIGLGFARAYRARHPVVLPG
ncbi:MAG: hypothetical protein QOI11_3514 [Candidatus Eremiobacteraeota bacterium]|jgi:hypothetical protein|nr:hypothetical protein [Candidatus Eremiobacteraeota bacterium]